MESGHQVTVEIIIRGTVVYITVFAVFYYLNGDNSYANICKGDREVD